MKPIVGDVTYKDLKPEDIDRYVAEAHAMRAEAMSGAFDALIGLVAEIFKAPTKGHSHSPAERVHGTIVGAS